MAVLLSRSVLIWNVHSSMRSVTSLYLAIAISAKSAMQEKPPYIRLPFTSISVDSFITPFGFDAARSVLGETTVPKDSSEARSALGHNDFGIILRSLCTIRRRRTWLSKPVWMYSWRHVRMMRLGLRRSVHAASAFAHDHCYSCLHHRWCISCVHAYAWTITWTAICIPLSRTSVPAATPFPCCFGILV